MSFGQWFGHYFGHWFGQAQTLPPGFIAGTATIIIGASAKLYGQKQAFIAEISGGGSSLPNNDDSYLIHHRNRLKAQEELTRKIQTEDETILSVIINAVTQGLI